MNILHKRFLAFLFLCIPARITIALIAKYVNTKYLPYLGYLALLPAIGFAYIFILKVIEKRVVKHLDKKYGGIIYVQFTRSCLLYLHILLLIKILILIWFYLQTLLLD